MARAAETDAGGAPPAPAPGIEIRVLAGAAELHAARRVFETALVGMGFPEPDDILAQHEPGRTFGAFDTVGTPDPAGAADTVGAPDPAGAFGTVGAPDPAGAADTAGTSERAPAAPGALLVGTAEAHTSWLTVPGGARLPHAAVTGVGVLATHTRRGILSGLMQRLLSDARARGEVVASLRASEAVIYERFGFGVATRAARYLINCRAHLRDGVDAGDRVWLADPRSRHTFAAMRRVADEVRWVGSIGRWDGWWRWQAQRAAFRGGPHYVVLAGTPAHVRGYVSYRPADTSRWFSGDDRIAVDSAAALDQAAAFGLLRYLLGLDLVNAIELRGPVGAPLHTLFRDPRAVTLLEEEDETWLRLLDVGRALSARSYNPGPDVVLEVTDALLPDNSGRYRIGEGGAVRTDADADLSLDVAALAAAYLGGTRFADLALAGRVRELRPGAVADADARCSSAGRAPWAGAGF